MTLIGLTGGVGMGKSTAAELLEHRGVQVIDTDLIARDLVAPGQPALTEIRQLFGEEFISEDETLRRAALADRVFSDPAARLQLEAILHPRIRSVWLHQVEIWRVERRNLAAVVIPLLFETNASSLFDFTVCVACTRPTQEERLSVRGWSSREIDRRVQAQWSIEKKMTAADFVIWSEGDLSVHAAQLERIIRKYEQIPGS